MAFAVGRIGFIKNKKDRPVETPNQQDRVNRPEKSPEQKEKNKGQNTENTNEEIATLASYMRKASGQVAKAKLNPISFKKDLKISNRIKGLKMAAKKISEQNISKYIKRAKLNECFETTVALPNEPSSEALKHKALLKALANKATDLLIVLPDSKLEHYQVQDKIRQALEYINCIHDVVTYEDK